jgi:hypothetical protein
LFYNLREVEITLTRLLSTPVDLTGAASPPMFGSKRLARVSRNRPLFFP